VGAWRLSMIGTLDRSALCGCGAGRFCTASRWAGTHALGMGTVPPSSSSEPSPMTVPPSSSSEPSPMI